MSDVRIPPALDRHLVSAAHTAATTSGAALGAFDAVVEQIVQSLQEQGAGRAEIELALRDVFSGLASPFRRTEFAGRYAELRARAVGIATGSVRVPPTGVRPVAGEERSFGR